MKVSDLGEFALIERLAGILTTPDPEDVVVGIGDDAAVWRSGVGFVIATTDTMVDGVHFTSSGADWQSIGWKAFATNASDIAAMGGWPEYALVTLCLPLDTDLANLEQLYEGLRASAHACAAHVIGGDVVRSDTMTITVAVLGRAREKDGEPLLLRRDGAKFGDVIAVTGTLGDSAGGLRRLNEGATDGGLIERHLRPNPRLAHAGVAVGVGLRSGIDVSDGLLQDIWHICEMSGTGAVIRAADVPISDELRETYPEDALELACTGGEDYELVLAGPAEAMDRLNAEMVEGGVTIIGEIVDDPEHRVRLLDADGNEIRYERQGWDAFQ